MASVAPGQVATGLPSFGSFNPSTFETINEGNLNAHFEIPIVAKAGRGIPFSYSLTYDSAIWAPANSSGAAGWTPAANWGWGAVTQVLTGYVSFDYTPPNPPCGPAGQMSVYAIASNFQYHDSFGAIHTFPGALAYYSMGSSTYCGPNLPSSETGIQANDGSGYSLSASMSGTGAYNVSGGVLSKSGVSIAAPFSTGTGSGTVTDSNGNYVSASLSGTTTNFSDTLGTTALTVGGSATPSSPQTFTYNNPGGTTSKYTVNYMAYTVQTSFGCSGVSEVGATSVNLVSSVVLPDATQYTMTYELTSGSSVNVTGRLKTVTLPTGGTITFSYASSGTTNPITCTDGSPSYLSRNSVDGTWKYTHSESASAWTNTVTDPALNETDIKFQSVNTGEIINAYEVQRVTHAGASTVLQTLNTCYDGTASPCTTTAVSVPITQVDQYTIWPTGSIESEVSSSYDFYGNNTQTSEYGYGSGAPGSLLRQTVTAFATLTGIYDHPGTVTVYNGSGTIYGLTKYQYDQTTAVATSGTPMHNTTVGGSRGNVTTVQRLTGGSTYLTWTITNFDTGNVQTITDPNTSVTTQSYGSGTSCGNSFATGTAMPLSLTRSYTWNCNGAVQLTTTDENSKIWTTTYSDPNYWRPTAFQDPTGANTTYAYSTSPAYAVESALLFNSGNSTQDVLATLDVLGRPATTQVKQSPTSTNYDTVWSTYDSNGRLYQVTMPYSAAARGHVSNAPTTTTYDALNRPLVITDGGGGTTTYTYQGNNDVLVAIGPAATGENIKQRQIQYDGLGRISSVCEVTAATGSGACGQNTAKTGFLTTYAYDPLDDVTSIVQNTQTGSTTTQTRTFTWDAMSRMLSEANPETGGTAYTYTYDTNATCGTSNGDLVKRLDAAGNTTCYAYDSLHRVTTVTYPSGPYSSVTPTKTFIYDSATVNSAVMSNAKSRLAEAYTGSVMSKKTDLGFSYSSRGEVTDTYESTANSGGYYHISSTFWANGLLDTLSTNVSGYPTLTYAPDGEGRVSTISASSGQNPVTATTYNTLSQPTAVTYGSLDSDAFGFDPNTGRPTSYAASVNGVTKTGTITNNTNGTIQKVATADNLNSSGTQTCTYTYDDEQRIVTNSCGTAWTGSYSYDAFGNISKSGSTSFMPTYNLSTNRYQTLPAATPVYDANGNVTADGFHTYAWDAEGRTVTIDSGTFTYDALDRRLDFGASGSYQQYFYPPFDLNYNFGQAPGAAGGQLGLRVPSPNGGQVNMTPTGVNGYRHPNWQGSQVVNSSTTRTAAADNAFTPFGERYAETSYSGYFAGMLMQYPYMTDGYQADERLYHDGQGRWVSPDPAGLDSVDLTNPQSLNRYVYVINDPLNNMDPSGLYISSGGTGPPPSTSNNQFGAGFCIPDTGWSYTGTPGQSPCNSIVNQLRGGMSLFWGQSGGGGGGGPGSGPAVAALSPMKPNCPPDKQRFFSWLAAPLSAMASSLGTTSRLMLTMAAKEGGWTTANLNHNQPLNNPFGVNRIRNKRAVGNVNYRTLSDAIVYWQSQYGPRVQGVTDPSEFVDALQNPKPGQGQPYNTSSAATYSVVFVQVYNSVGNYMFRCGVQ